MITADILVRICQLIEFIFIIAARVLFGIHSTAATFVIVGMIEIHSGTFAQAIMHLHGHTRGNHQVEKRQYGKKYLLHAVKLQFN